MRLVALRKELLQLSRAAGKRHPALISSDDFDILNDHFGRISATECFHYKAGWGIPNEPDRDKIEALMSA